MSDNGTEILPVCGEKYDATGRVRSEFNLAGVLVVVGSYLVVMAIGSLASRIKTGKWKVRSSEEQVVGDRNMGIVIGIFTMTATWIGGGFINGTAETVFTPYVGLAWTVLPWTLCLSFVIGGLIFAKPMREREYVTILDPFMEKYGRVVTGLIFMAPLLLGELFYVSAILASLGGTLSVIAGIGEVWSVVISAAVVVIYTMIGGLYSVAYTDIIQICFMFFGLWLCVPFAMLNDAVTPIKDTATVAGGWVGEVPPDPQFISLYVDTVLLLVFGAIPWQAYFQRVLCQKSPETARVMSIISGFTCMLMCIPSVIIGAVAFSTDWNATDYRDYSCIPVPESDYPMALPLVLRYLLPEPVAIIGLGAVAAAIMSSVDSTLLCVSSAFCRHIYAPIYDFARPRFNSDRKVTESENLWVANICIIIFAVFGSLMALYIKSIIGLWYLGAELIYCIMFPMLILVLFMKDSNSYGAFVAFWTGLILRLLSGEPLINLPAVIQFPWFEEIEDGIGVQYFPFRLVIMLITLTTHILFSYLTKFLFVVCGLPKKLDVFENFTQSEDDTVERSKKHGSKYEM